MIAQIVIAFESTVYCYGRVRYRALTTARFDLSLSNKVVLQSMIHIRYSVIQLLDRCVYMYHDAAQACTCIMMRRQRNHVHSELQQLVNQQSVNQQTNHIIIASSLSIKVHVETEYLL